MLLRGPTPKGTRPLRTRDPVELAERLLAGDRGALPRLLSVVEHGGPPAREASRILYPQGGKGYTVGITGAPGAGKSTLTNRLIAKIRSDGGEVAVLAVDPTSPFTGGALLGDRVRMMDHALDPGVYVRSMATRGHLGGLALAAPEAIRTLDAAGFPLILVETVGVGQVEVEVAGSADTTVVVLNPGAGDSVQANKAGLLEVADLFVINKADRSGVGELERDLRFMLELTVSDSEWQPPILRAVAAKGEGVAEVLESIGKHRQFLESSGELLRRRARRLGDELREILTRRIEQRALELFGDRQYRQLLADVQDRHLDPYEAADRILAGGTGNGEA
jgi:LAO/AO transport system kinase